ncbi:hypothetical protein Tco_0442943 [Tanacetum coccineum]
MNVTIPGFTGLCLPRNLAAWHKARFSWVSPIPKCQEQCAATVIQIRMNSHRDWLGFSFKWMKYLTSSVDEGSSVEVMFEHCFENLNPKIKAGLREAQTDMVGFAREISKPLGKIEMEVCFSNEGICRRTSMKFIVVRAPSPYNIILGRPGLKTLRAIPSTIHSMLKFPTPKGVATLVTRTIIIAECRRLEKKQVIKEESPEGKGEVAATEEVLVNPSFPD